MTPERVREMQMALNCKFRVVEEDTMFNFDFCSQKKQRKPVASRVTRKKDQIESFKKSVGLF